MCFALFLVLVPAALHASSGGDGASVTSAKSGRSVNRSHAGVAESQEGPLPPGEFFFVFSPLST